MQVKVKAAEKEAPLPDKQQESPKLFVQEAESRRVYNYVDASDSIDSRHNMTKIQLLIKNKVLGEAANRLWEVIRQSEPYVREILRQKYALDLTNGDRKRLFKERLLEILYLVVWNIFQDAGQPAFKLKKEKLNNIVALLAGIRSCDLTHLELVKLACNSELHTYKEVVTVWEQQYEQGVPEGNLHNLAYQLIQNLFPAIRVEEFCRALTAHQCKAVHIWQQVLEIARTAVIVRLKLESAHPCFFWAMPELPASNPSICTRPAIHVLKFSPEYPRGRAFEFVEAEYD